MEHNLPQPGDWLKLGDAAYLLGISEITLRRKVKCGKIPHDFRNGKYFVYLQKNANSGKYFDSSAINRNDLSEKNTTIDALKKQLQLKNATIQKLNRVLEDQQTLIVFLEDTIKLFGAQEKYSSKKTEIEQRRA